MKCVFIFIYESQQTFIYDVREKGFNPFERGTFWCQIICSDVFMSSSTISKEETFEFSTSHWGVTRCKRVNIITDGNIYCYIIITYFLCVFRVCIFVCIFTNMLYISPLQNNHNLKTIWKPWKILNEWNIVW